MSGEELFRRLSKKLDRFPSHMEFRPSHLRVMINQVLEEADKEQAQVDQMFDEMQADERSYGSS